MSALMLRLAASPEVVIETGSKLTGQAWPVAMPRLKAAMIAQREALLDMLRPPCGDLAVDCLRLAGNIFCSSAGAIAELALAVESERFGGAALAGIPELDWLRSGDGAVPQVTVVHTAAESTKATVRSLRRLARVASWTSPVRLPRAILHPDAIAISHNKLLQSVAQRGSHAVGFHHADTWLADIVQAATPRATPGSIRDLTHEASRRLASAIGVDSDITARVATLLTKRLEPLMETAHQHLLALRQAALPQAIWSGTGGYWPSRAMGIEVLRRGGTARRFDHGGSLGTIDDRSGLRLIELTVSNEFVLPTPELAALVQTQLGPQPVRIIGGEGDPHFALRPGPVRQQKLRPRVIYATTASLGFRRLLPLNLPDEVYVDWQLRIARLLRGLDIDLVLKPHPEGLFRGQPHPLDSIQPTERGNFEAALQEADVAVFDFAASTTFWAALSSHCPVIFLDSGLVDFDPTVRTMLERRIRIIPIRFDECNRPQINRHDLVNAIRDPLIADPSEFRALLAGRFGQKEFV